MRNYDFQYRQYYDGLKNKSGIKNYQPHSSFDEYTYKYSNGYNSNSIRKKGNAMSWYINAFIVQLIGSTLLLLLVFGGRYSDSAELKSVYKFLKDGISEKVTYTQIKEDIENLDTTTVMNNIKKSVKWVKEKIETNPMN